MTNSARYRGVSARRALRTTAALALAGTMGFGILGSPAFAETAPLNAPTQQKTELSSLPSFADLVEKVSPAVVSIRVVEEETVADVEQPDLPFPPGSPFDKFFKQLQPKGPDGKPLKRKAMAQGSGFFITADGYAVTNNHVVQGGKDITVVQNDGTELKATLVGRDQKTDLALIKVKASKPMPYVAFGDSDKLRVGDWVLAVGNPFGLGGTVTSGIVSARGREIGAGPYDDFLQIDASINRGNSGGPTFDIHGNVVGVNTAIFSPTGGSVGIGFAIPANLVSSTVASAMAGKGIKRPWFGASGEAVTSEIAQGLGMARPNGVLVGEVWRGGPADRAGLKAGDVVLAIDGREVNDPQALRFRIATRKLGDTAALDVLRRGQRLNLQIALQDAPETPARNLTQLSGNQPLAGATVGNLSPAFADELGLDMLERGVIVTEIAPGSTAARLRLRTGDIVMKINDREVEDVKSLQTLLRGGNQWTVTLRRNKQVLSFTVRL